ncbi:MAG TPA: hypothetical protein VNV35_07830 [Puia sp.]|jgi:hypothetical protein|nr:hypothetical protein [Puia sp.]
MKFPFNRAMAFLIVSSAFLLAVTSCKKSNSNGSGSGSMSASIGGTAWANNYPLIGFYASSSGVGLFDIVGLQFKSGDSTTFDLEFGTPITLNHPVSSDTSAFIAAYTDSKTQADYGVLPGFGDAVLTITSYDSTGHTIAGTFSGVLYNLSTFTDSLVVTNGKFNSSFTVN